MSTHSAKHRSSVPKRTKIFFPRGFQLRFALLVAGSLLVLLFFAGFHGIFMATSTLSPEAFEELKPELLNSTWRLFLVGILYVIVVTAAATFLSHRTVGPTTRLEKEIKRIAHSKTSIEPLSVRDGDELEGMVGAVNELIHRMKK